MNWLHLRAMLWMRWRILLNRMSRGGRLNNTLFAVLLALIALVSVGSFLLALKMGLALLPDATPMGLMLVWAGLACGYLFFWMIGLLTDLQRSDAMSFKHLQHLPVSLGWVFVYNYLSSWVSLSVALFLPAMLGLCAALIAAGGPALLVSLPLMLGYFTMITALTYQLRGWLARLMENKRGGRNVVAIITLAFVLLVNAPNLINLAMTRSPFDPGRDSSAEQIKSEQAAQQEGSGPARPRIRLERFRAKDQRDAQRDRELDRQFSLAAEIVPVGWMPYGMRAAFEGRWLAAGLCALGLLLISAWSLRRSYRTTLASVMGAGGGGAQVVALGSGATGAGDGPARAHKPPLVARRLPFVDERTAGITLACLRSLTRAPEVKLVLLSPVILLGLFAVMLAKNPRLDSLAPFAPLMELGALTVGLLSINQLLQNQFGLDRAGFRVFLLSPVPRRQILLAKNLAVAPLAMGVSLIALIALQFFVPVGPAHFLAACVQIVSAYLLLCMVMNLLSILGPVRLMENGLKAAEGRLRSIFQNMLVMILIPLALSPLLLPFGLEFLLRGFAWTRPLPLYLALHVAELGGILLAYRWVLRRQGRLLQLREQQILDLLTRR